MTNPTIKLTPNMLANMNNGKFTIENTATNEHRTYRVRKGNFGGTEKLILGLLTGSDNETSYTNFAFVNIDLDNAELTINPWRKYCSGDSSAPSQWEKHAKLVAALALGHTFPQLNVLGSGVCAICGKPLTDPESIRTSIGPICRAKIGMI